MATCENCGLELPRTGKVCPYCGAKRDDNSGCGVLGVLIVLGVIFLIGKCTGGGEKEKTDQETTKTEQFIDNTPTNSNKPKSKKRKKRRSKKRHYRQSIICVIDNASAYDYWTVMNAD